MPTSQPSFDGIEVKRLLIDAGTFGFHDRRIHLIRLHLYLEADVAFTDTLDRDLVDGFGLGSEGGQRSKRDALALCGRASVRLMKRDLPQLATCS